MVREEYESLKTEGDLRKSLIALKQELKEQGAREQLLEFFLREKRYKIF